jgi:large subunit ribosomal protein L23
MQPYEVLKRPILTEKTSIQADLYDTYTFEVALEATKQEIRDAVERAFDVIVDDVRVLRMPGKKRRFGRYPGVTSMWKKAVIKVAPGESISFFEGV